MAGELTITATDVALVRKIDVIEGVASVDLAAGECVRLDGTSGKLVKAEGDSAATLGYRLGIVIKSAKADRPVTALAKGLISLGNALSAVAFGAPLYVSDTAGSIATSAGTVSKIAGTVEPVWSTANGVPDKLLRVDL